MPEREAIAAFEAGLGIKIHLASLLSGSMCSENAHLFAKNLGRIGLPRIKAIYRFLKL